MIGLNRTLLILTAFLGINAANANDAAYILLYHHVDADTPSSTSVTPELFAEHMEYIDKARFRVVPLDKLLKTLKNGGRIKPRTLAITFDDAYPSVIKNAFPVLSHHKFPFTVFANTATIDAGTGSYMSWDDLRKLESKRGSIANHGHHHQHMVVRQENEDFKDWQTRIRGDIEFAQQRLEEELKRPAKLFAYPYGEFNDELVNLLEEMDYPAVGQQSGPVGPASHPHAVPRFPMAGDYASIPQLAEKLSTRPFNVVSPALPATIINADDERPTLELKFVREFYRASRMACYVTSLGTARARWQDPEATEAKVTSRETLPAGRTSYTCTAPHESIPDLYYWHSHLFMKPQPDGSWYEN